MIILKGTEKHIVKKLRSNNFEIFIVGGAVRDHLMGLKPKDIDLVTNATPDQLQELFKHHKIKHEGTRFKVTFIDGVEVATYRKDIYEEFNGGLVLTEVKYAKTLEEDLARRDITINAMAMHPYKLFDYLIDPFDGKKDLKNKKIRFVDTPSQRIKEDPVRILRACRFLAKIDGRFDEKSFYALREYAHLLFNEPFERIYQEIMKTMDYFKASKFFIALRNIGILKNIFPQLHQTVGLDGGKYHDENVFDHSMMTGDNIIHGDPILKLAGYLHDYGKPLAYLLNCDGSFTGHDKIGKKYLEDDLKRLKFPNHIIKFISDCTMFHMSPVRTITEKKRNLRRFLNKIEKKKRCSSFGYKHFILLNIADNMANLKNENFTAKEIKHFYDIYEEVINEKEPFSIKDLTINGNNVMKILDIKPGRIIGEILNKLADMVLDNPNLNQKKFLIPLMIIVHEKIIEKD